MNKAHEISTQEEARNLAHEAVDAKKAGDKAEANFLMEAARDLDPKAAADGAGEAGDNTP